MEQQKTPAEIAQQQRDEERFGKDQAKQFRLSLNGKEMIQDEYFEDVPLKAFEKPGQELKQLISERTKSEVLKTRDWLQKKGFIK